MSHVGRFGWLCLGWMAVLIASAGGAAAEVDPLDFATKTPVGRGYAKSNINATAFAFNIASLDDWQVAAWYRPLDGDRPGGLRVIRRNLVTGDIDVTDLPSPTNDPGTFVANNINDNHDVVSVGIDGSGFVHLSWGMHGDPSHYSRSNRPIADGPLTFDKLGDQPIPGQPRGVTYPEFVRLPDGDLLFQYRVGGSGNGDTMLARLGTEEPRHTVVQSPLIDGFVRGTDDGSVNAYTNGLTLDRDGVLHQTWTFRSEAGPNALQTNHNLYYAFSVDGGKSWQNNDGQPHTLPITQATASPVLEIPKGSSYINQTGMTVDRDNQPVVATRWATGDEEPYYRLAWRNGDGIWESSKVAPLASGSRPDVAVLDDAGRDRVLVIYQNDASNGRITVAHSLNRTDWTFIQIDDVTLGDWEGRYDDAHLRRTGELSFLHQPTRRGRDAEPVTLFDWNAAGYFEQLRRQAASD